MQGVVYSGVLCEMTVQDLSLSWVIDRPMPLYAPPRRPSATRIFMSPADSTPAPDWLLYKPFGNDRYSWWESAQTNSGAVGHYSNLAGAYSFVPAVGYASVTDPSAWFVAHMNANASFVDQPILYHSLGTSNPNVSQTYNADDQVSCVDRRTSWLNSSSLKRPDAEEECFSTVPSPRQAQQFNGFSLAEIRVVSKDISTLS
ncbi:hypothetical protein B0T12DRAFT_503146 [Alternaria alternata]|jgi:hypothetical protein|nr:hypothetical protein B0T12DRAFT_503146 [Alternaria alternata]